MRKVSRTDLWRQNSKGSAYLDTLTFYCKDLVNLLWRTRLGDVLQGHVSLTAPEYESLALQKSPLKTGREGCGGGLQLSSLAFTLFPKALG